MTDSPKRPKFLAELMLAAASVLAPSVAAQPPAACPADPVPQVRDLSFLSADELQATNRCVDLIRGCQLPNGAFNMRTERDPNNEDDRKQARENGEDPNVRKVDTIRVIPYFANHSAMALISAHHNHTHDIEDMQRVAKWIHFYAKHQDEKTGYITDYKGSLSKGTFESSKQIDSVDAYASTFLQLADRYTQELKHLTPMQRVALEKIAPPEEILQAAKLSLKAIESLKHEGLTWAKPDYKVKYLVDNVEVEGGLQQGARYFKAVGANEEAAKATDMAKEIGGKLGNFWVPDQHRFGWAIMENGKVECDMDKSYPGGLANLCGLAWISAKDTRPWDEVKTKFKEPDAHAPAERWLMAAIAVGNPDEIKLYRDKCIADAKTFNAATNGHRPAMALLTLQEGRSWMPSLPDPLKLDAPARDR